MKTESLLYKVMVLVVAGLVLNQIACSNASFNKSQSNKAQTGSPDSGATGANNDGDTTNVDCNSKKTSKCNVGDSGITADHEVDIPPGADDGCFYTKYTFSNQEYLLESKIIRFPIYAFANNADGYRQLQSSEIDMLEGGIYSLYVEVNGRLVGFDYNTFKNESVIVPDVMGQEVFIEYCLK